MLSFENYQKSLFVVIVALLISQVEAGEKNNYENIQNNLNALVQEHLPSDLDAQKELELVKEELSKNASKPDKHLEKMSSLVRITDNIACNKNNRDIIIPLLVDTEFSVLNRRFDIKQLHSIFDKITDKYMENCRALHMSMLKEAIASGDPDNLSHIDRMLTPSMFDLLNLVHPEDYYKKLVTNPIKIWNTFIGSQSFEYYWKPRDRQLLFSWAKIGFENMHRISFYEHKPQNMPESLATELLDTKVKPPCVQYNKHFLPNVFKSANFYGVLPKSGGIKYPTVDTNEIEFFRLWAFSKLCSSIIDGYIGNGHHVESDAVLKSEMHLIDL